ncbi:MAG: response regulator [Thermodesulfobacteriota bacterium]
MTKEKMIVFLIGGDETEQQIISRQLHQDSLYDTITATSVEEIHHQMGKHPVDVILLNHGDPGVPDPPFLPTIAERPVIHLIPADRKYLESRIMKDGAIDYLLKDSEGHYLSLLPLAIRNTLMRRQQFLSLVNDKKMKAITSLAGGIAHQFNNKLVGISGNLELLEIALPDNPAVKKYGERIKSAVKQISYFTEQLLAYSRQGKHHPQKTPLNAFIRSVLPALDSVKTKHIHLELTFCDRDVLVDIDYSQMRLVLAAVINNAVEAVADNGWIQLSTGSSQVKLPRNPGKPSARNGLHACITVTDHGKGMEAETADRIFEPFFTTNFQGRGLEMAAAHGIVSNHNGWITVASEPGSGTTVAIFLPAEPLHEETSTPEMPVRNHRSKGAVLLIDDEELVIEVGTEMLKKMGFDVIIARTGEQALRIAETCRDPIDIVLLDIGLPDMSGNEIYPLLTEVLPNIKVIVCSGYSIDGKAEEILKAGAHGYIQKPFAFGEFSAKLTSVHQS